MLMPAAATTTTAAAAAGGKSSHDLRISCILIDKSMLLSEREYMEYMKTKNAAAHAADS